MVIITTYFLRLEDIFNYFFFQKSFSSLEKRPGAPFCCLSRTGYQVGMSYR